MSRRTRRQCGTAIKGAQPFDGIRPAAVVDQRDELHHVATGTVLEVGKAGFSDADDQQLGAR